MYRSLKFLEAMSAYDSENELLAFRLMEECAEAGEPAACFTMALWCAGKCDMPMDQKRSSRWLARFEELAENGNLEAQWDLGQSYRFGNLLPQNIERANYWLERAAEGGYGEAQHHLAWYYEFGQYGYPVDKVAAERWYKKAFEQEHPETLYLFAVKLFKNGQPTEDAVRLLSKAAGKGFTQAQHVLDSYRH
jgi:TPR repeat protein